MSMSRCSRITIDLTRLSMEETPFLEGFYEGEMNEAITEDTQLGVFETCQNPGNSCFRPVSWAIFIRGCVLDVLDNMQGTPLWRWIR